MKNRYFIYIFIVSFLFSFVIYSYCKNNSNIELLLNKSYAPKVLKHLKNAKKEVYINAYIWCCHADKYGSIPCKILDTVIHLVKKGVKVIVIFDKRKRDDLFCNKETILILKHTLLKKYKNLQVYYDLPDVTSHEKVILIDGQYVFLGSHNITQSALKYNNEVSVFIKSEKIYNKLKKYLKNIILSSEKIY